MLRDDASGLPGTGASDDPLNAHYLAALNDPFYVGHLKQQAAPSFEVIHVVPLLRDRVEPAIREALAAAFKAFIAQYDMREAHDVLRLAQDRAGSGRPIGMAHVSAALRERHRADDLLRFFRPVMLQASART